MATPATLQKVTNDVRELRTGYVRMLARFDDLEAAAGTPGQNGIDGAPGAAGPPGPSVGAGYVVRVTDYPVVGDGVEDDTAAIQSAINAMKLAKGGRGTLDFPLPAVKYRVTKALIFDGLTNIRITGLGSAIVFDSNNSAASSGGAIVNSSTPGYDGQVLAARGAFYIKNCSDVVIEDLVLEGNGTDTEMYSSNVGVAVYLGVNARRVRIRNVTQFYGYGLVLAQRTADNAIVEACYSYGSRGNSGLGDGGNFRDCTFELPTTASYDRVDSTHGSSHAIYQFSASGGHFGVYGCNFKNIRLDCVKVSGSASPLRGFITTGCKFVDCGYNADGTNSSGACVVFGADNTIDAVIRHHCLFSVTNNIFLDCQVLVVSLGAKNVLITANSHHRSKVPVAPSVALIQVGPYNGTAEPVEDVMITGNVFSSELQTDKLYAVSAVLLSGVGERIYGTNFRFIADASTNVMTSVQTADGVTPVAHGLLTGNGPLRVTSSVTHPGGLNSTGRFYAIKVTDQTFKLATTAQNALDGVAIDLSSAGTGSHFIGTMRASNARVFNNQVGHGVSNPVLVTGGFNAIVENNSMKGILGFVDTRSPRIVRNDVLDLNSETAAIRMTRVSWPLILNNLGSGTISNRFYKSQAETGNNRGDGVPVLFPLGGFQGRARAAHGRPELVIAYGSKWTAGDVLEIQNTKYTFGQAAPTGWGSTLGANPTTDFNELKALLNGPSGGGSGVSYLACSDYGDPWGVITEHLLVRWSVASSASKLFYATSDCASPLAGVVLPNNAGGAQPFLCYSRSEGADKVTIWSPAATIGKIPFLRAENEAAAIALHNAQPFLVSVNSTGEGGCCATLQITGMDASDAALTTAARNVDPAAPEVYSHFQWSF